MDSSSQSLSSSSNLLNSHPMVTRAKTSIFRTRHLANHTALCFSNLITALLASTEHKGFKFAAKNLVWLTIMIEKYELWKIIKLGSWSLILPTPILWALNGCSEPNIILMTTLTDSMHVLSQRVIRRYLVLTTLIPSILLWRLLLFLFLLLSPINGQFINLMPKISSSMSLLMKMSIWSSLLAVSILAFLIMSFI